MSGPYFRRGVPAAKHRSLRAVGGQAGHVAGRVKSLNEMFAEAKAKAKAGDVATPSAASPSTSAAMTARSAPTPAPSTPRPRTAPATPTPMPAPGTLRPMPAPGTPRHPGVDYTSRGGAEGAFAAASSSSSRAIAVVNLETDMHAASSYATRKSTLGTWLRFHQEWFGDSVEPFPLTEEVLTAVAAMFKAGRYRSFPQYLSRAEEEHVRHEHAWTQVLDWVAKQCGRSVTRGIGPARQSAGFSVADVVNLETDHCEVVEQGPLNGQAMLVVASFFMLREAEMSAATVGHLHMDEVKKEVTLTLSVSKTDVKALGVQRSWGCVCSGMPRTPCPVCFLAAHIKVLAHEFGEPLPKDLPLFPTATGEVPTKAKVVATIEHFMTKLGKETIGIHGNKVFGGHSCRVAGARYMASLGIDLLTIQLLGRWGSDVVLRYVSEVPLGAVTKRIVDIFKTASLEEMTRVNEATLEKKLTEMNMKTEQLDILKDELGRLKIQMMEAPASSASSSASRGEPPRFVANEDSRVVHAAASCLGPTSSWTTRCGWAFAKARSAAVRDIPVPGWARCATCFRHIHVEDEEE